MSDTVNTGFILDIQPKLYRWSAADPDKRFADLFNIVCDRRTWLRAWERLARNRGSDGHHSAAGEAAGFRTPRDDGCSCRWH